MRTHSMTPSTLTPLRIGADRLFRKPSFLHGYFGALSGASLETVFKNQCRKLERKNVNH